VRPFLLVLAVQIEGLISNIVVSNAHGVEVAVVDQRRGGG